LVDELVEFLQERSWEIDDHGNDNTTGRPWNITGDTARNYVKEVFPDGYPHWFRFRFLTEGANDPETSLAELKVKSRLTMSALEKYIMAPEQLEDEFDRRNIPILLMNAEDTWEKKTAYIGTNNLELGKKAGILLAAQLQPGDQVALLGKQTAIEEERIKGAKMSLDTVGIKVVTEKVDLPINDSSAVEEAMQSILREHPDLKGVMTSSDFIAIPALKVIREHGLEIPVTGTDGLTEMLTAIKQGTLTSTVGQNPYDMGYLSIETAIKVIKGEKVQPIIDSGVDIITKGNADQRLKFLNNVLDE